MSRIGKLSILLPSKVTVEVSDSQVKVAGPKGSLTHRLPQGIGVVHEGNTVRVVVLTPSKRASALHGLTRNLIANMVTGVSTGFEKGLELMGVGYRAELKGRTLQLSVGYSHPVVFELPEGISARLEGPTKIVVEGIDKQLVGETAATIRRYKLPEPYKGKGIKYVDEVIKRKIGKKGIK